MFAISTFRKINCLNHFKFG